jgi:uncharacterized protein YndB with AHSA1/START domain
MSAPHGTLLTDGDAYVLRFERLLARAPARVWTALTTPDGLAAWFPARVTVDLRVGGRMTFYFSDHDTAGPDGEVVELDEPRRFAFRWGEDVLRFDLVPAGGGTRLVFTHRFTDRGMAARQGAGWEHCLDALAGEPVGPDRMAELLEAYAAAFDHGADGTVGEAPDGRTRLRFERRLAHGVDRVWRALTEPDELAGWLAEASLDLRPGGAVELRWLNSEAVLHGTVAELDPPRVLALETDLHGRLRWELLREGDGCLLTFTVDLDATPDVLPLELAGWHVHLEHLAAALDGRPVDWSRWDADDRPRWQEHHDRYAARTASLSSP